MDPTAQEKHKNEIGFLLRPVPAPSSHDNRSAKETTQDKNQEAEGTSPGVKSRS